MFSISIVWGKGILVTVDSRSMDPGFPEPRNVRVIIYRGDGRDKPLAVVSGYGDDSLLSSLFQIAEDVFIEWFDTAGSRSWRNPGELETRRIVSQIEERILERYKDLKNLGITPNAQLSLALVTQDGSPKLYYFNEKGLASPRHQNPGYIVLGSPTSVAIAEAFIRAVGYSPLESIGLNVGLLSAFMISLASEVDPGVSPYIGDSIYMRYDPGENDVVVGSIKDQVLIKMMERLERRREAIKLLWRAMDILGDEREERVLRLLKGLVEGSASKQEQ
jgi:hypothetical protein